MSAASSVSFRARAKINLALHVIGRRPDGYHLLDSIVAFADVADIITLALSNSDCLSIAGPFADQLSAEPDNIVLRACRAFRSRFPDAADGYSVKLEKYLPVASGIGGGSADAAAVLKGLVSLSGLPVSNQDLAEIGLALGADVPVCLCGIACRMSGVGEHVQAIEPFPAIPAVLVNPGCPISTQTIFNQLGLEPGAIAMPVMPELPVAGGEGDWLDWLAGQRNDLQQSAIHVEPVISETLAIISAQPGCRVSRMSGSGATCFGLFERAREARAAAQYLQRESPDWWVVGAMLS